jgi:hypothetical protein
MRGQHFFSIAFATLATLTLFVAGCSGSGTSVPVAPIGAALAPILPSATAFSASSSATPASTSGATTLSLPLPASATYSGTAIFPVASVPPNLVLTLTYSNRPPAGLSAFAAKRRTASTTPLRPQDAFSTNAVYACFAANYLVTLDGAPQYTFVLPPGLDPSGIVYYLALWQNAQWVSGYGGPGTIAASTSATTVTVTGRFPFAIPPNGKVCVALYGRWTTAPTPVAATPPPNVTLPVTAAPVAINAAGGLALTVGDSDTLSINAADAPATATTTCATGSLATLTGAPGATFALTATAAGNCTVTLTNSLGKTTTIAVTVSAPSTLLPVTGAPVAILDGAVAITVGVPETLSISSAEGPATATTTCGTNSIATLAGSPGTSFTLTGTSAGTCAVTLRNASGRFTTIEVAVVSPAATPTPAESPTPVASATPTATPSPVISPASLAFTSAGVSLPLVLTETGYIGVLTESDTCSGIATVSPATGTGPSATFTVTSVAAGTCNVTITDSAGRFATAAIGVTTLGVTIQSKSRQL